MTSQLRVLVEQPTRGKRWVAVAADWPGLERGGKTEDEAVEKLARYVPRYLPVAKRVRLGSELATQTDVNIIGRYPGVGSTDFWGISFAPSSFELTPMGEDELERKLALLRAAWRFFDDVAARVSPEMERGPRGGGRDRDEIIRHALGWERADLVKRVGVVADPVIPPTPEGLRSHRDEYVAALRTYNAEGRVARGRNWTIALLLRHSAYHVLDHAWEMEDKDLS
jgi:hypothetical protein